MQEIYGVETPQIQSSPNGVAKSGTHYRADSPLSSSSSSSPSSVGGGQQLILVWRNCVVTGSGNGRSFFGPFFTCQISREASFKQIQGEIMNQMKAIVKKSVDGNLISESVLFALRVVGTGASKNYLPDDVDHPLYMPCECRALVFAP